MDVQLNPVTPQIAAVKRAGARQGRGKGFNQSMQEETAENDGKSEDSLTQPLAKRTLRSSAETKPGKRSVSGDGKGLKVDLLA